MIDENFQPAITLMTDYQIPGAGIILALIILYLLGIIGKNFIGKKVLRLIQEFLLRIPIVKGVYSIVKKMTESFTALSNETSGKIVAVPYPSESSLTLGIAMSSFLYKGRKSIAVYIPSPPSPQSGNLTIFSEEQVEFVDISMGIFMQYIFSNGAAAPSAINIVTKKDT